MFVCILKVSSSCRTSAPSELSYSERIQDFRLHTFLSIMMFKGPECGTVQKASGCCGERCRISFATIKISFPSSDTEPSFKVVTHVVFQACIIYTFWIIQITMLFRQCTKVGASILTNTSAACSDQIAADGRNDSNSYLLLKLNEAFKADSMMS